jgi:hypothetical protein
MGLHFDDDGTIAEVVEIEAGPAGRAVGEGGQDTFNDAFVLGGGADCCEQ